MVWRLRVEAKQKLPTGRLTPDYGSDNGKFTIRIHHSGIFITLGKTEYVGGKFSHVDHCDADEMSLIELSNMANEIGLQGQFAFYCNRGRGVVNDSNGLVLIQTDIDAMNLAKFVDKNRMVGVFIDHQNGLQNEFVGEVLQELPNGVEERTVKPVGVDVTNLDCPVFEGVFERTDGMDVEGADGVDVEDVEELVYIESPVHSEREHSTENLDIIDDRVNSDSESDQSMGSDSDFSEKLVDSDFEISDDDSMFDQNIDPEAEWGGLHEGRDESLQIITRTSLGNGFEQPRPNLHNGHPIFNLNLDKGFGVGLCFSDMKEFREAVRQDSIMQGREVRFTINDDKRVQAKCKHETCGWVVYASKVQDEDTVQIKTYNGTHQCPRLQRNTHANSRWLAEQYRDKIWSDPKWPVDSMIIIMQKDLKLHFNKIQMYRTKQRVLEMGGNDKEQYAMLWSYVEEIKRSNPDTTVKIKCKLVEGKPKFKRLYICWGSLKKGFLEGCRPVICLDGCHLKSVCGGILLCAVGIDANNCMYPFSYAVVEKEKYKSWMWFMEFLIHDLNIRNAYSWTIMSDKQKGLKNAIEELLPGCEHRFCVMHLYKNFKGAHKGLALKNLLWKAARATRVVDFEKAMTELKDRDTSAFDWLVLRPPTHWSKAYFSTHPKCDIMLNNMSESFNSLILAARSKPIVHMLESIRVILMKRLYLRRDEMRKHNGDICPKIVKYLEELKKKSMEFIAHWNGKDQFEIESSYGSRYRVHLGEKTCSCRRWELSGIPCAHAISGMYYCGYMPEDYVDECYKKKTYFKSYTHLMNTLHGSDMWPKSQMEPLLPPLAEVLPGRPKLHNRKKDKDEAKKKVKERDGKQKLSKVGVIMHCSICGKRDHNKKGCHKRKQPVEEGLDIPAPIGKGRGRPKKPSNVTEGESSATPKRGRGRPKKPSNMNEGESSAAAQRGRGRVQKNSSTSANVHAQSKVKSTTRVESVAPNVQRKSKSVGLRRNLQVHKEVSKNAVSSQLEIRAKDKAASTQQPTTLRNSALTKSVRMRRPTSLTRPAWVPPLSSMLNGVRFSTTKRGPQLSGKHVGTSVANEQPPQCSEQ